MFQSNYQQVLEFTNAVNSAKGLPLCPTKPIKMTKEEVIFIIKMSMSELAELADTVTGSTEETQQLMEQCLHADPSKHVTYNSDVEVISAQADAMVDAWYYMLNAATKKGMNLSEVFDLVHQANMNKLVDGKAIVREDGKVLKPDGWKEADIVGYFKSLLL